MKKMIFLFLILLCMGMQLHCINHMDLIQTMYGEFAGCEFGSNMASIDFNADGYDDLVIASQAWNPYGVYADSSRYGKLYFYWGGPGFDNIPDLIISGTYYNDIGSTWGGMSMYNVGDVNEDGADDLLISSSNINHDLKITILFSRQSPHIEPDVVLIYPTTGINYISVHPLGDINGDGHDDTSLTINRDGRYINSMLIWTDVNDQPWVFRQTSNQYALLLMNGIGDVNNDGIDDCFLQYPIQGLDQNNRKLVVYYGDTAFPDTDSLVIIEDTNQITTNWASPIGDVNHDGFADFVAYNNHLWLGSTNLTANWNLALTTTYGFTEFASGIPFLYGDFNNDGYDDIINTNHEYGWNSGVASVWLGGNPMNGTQDMHLFPPLDYENCNFGWAKAVGDFNADGFDDVAISSPWWNENDHNQTGRVFVYAGNAQLADTTVGIEDENISTPDVSKWEIKLSPNPMTNHTTKLNVKFLGDGYKHTDSIKIEIYDIKGRKIISKSISHNSLKEGNCDVTLKGIKPGIYILNVYESNTNVSSSKFTIK